MFFTLGLIGFLFACLAPGYIAVTAFRLQSHLPPLAGPFALTLIADNLLIETLVACGFYTHAVMVPLAVVTVFVAAVQLLRDKRLSLAHLSGHVRAAGDILAGYPGSKKTRLYSGIAFVLGLLALVEAIKISSEFARTAILGYDSLASWNRWAIDWATNIFPNAIGHYPQLLPILLSSPYVVTGNHEIQYFSVSFKILFWLFSFETLAFIALRCRNTSLLFSIPLLYFIFHQWIGRTALEDYADVPVSFFALLSAVTIIASEQERDTKRIALGLIFASGAAMTKQVGLYMLAATPALAIAWSYEQHRAFAAVRRTATMLLLPELLAVAAASPIYIYAIITIRNGTNTSELSYILSDQFGRLDFLARMRVAFARLFSDDCWPNVLSAFILFAGLVSARDRVFRWLLLLITLPFTLLWAANFSYDNRNLALAMPFWALCAAASLYQLSALMKPLRWLLSFIADFWRGVETGLAHRIYIVPVLLLVSIAALDVLKSERFSYAFLLGEQYRVERSQLGDRPQCNEKMISLLQTLPANHITLSEWRWACEFHFNNLKNCTRIFPQDLFADRNALSKYAGRNLLIILNQSSLTPIVQTALQNAQMTPAGTAQCDEAAAFYIRRKN